MTTRLDIAASEERCAFLRHFGPNWFAITMGTGIVSSVLAALPQVSAWQMQAASFLWLADGLLFSVFSLVLLARFAIFPESIASLLLDPIQSMFFGTIPMGLAPIINGLIVFRAGAHPEALPLAYGLWIADVVMSVVVALVVPFLAFTRQEHAWHKVTGILLLPLVAPEVAAASAALIAPHLLGAESAQTVVIGYALWAVSVPLAFMVLSMLFARLLMHKLPPRELAVSSWLSLGPIGTGALGLVTLGQSAVTAFGGTALQGVAVVARDFGILGGLLIWGAGLWWLASAILFVATYLKEGLPFNLGWWGFTFPLGVYTMATLALGKVTGFYLFEAIGVVLALLLFTLWLLVTACTLGAVTRGKLLVVPRSATVTTRSHQVPA